MASQQIIDLRSDTVTKPSVKMREVMAQTEVGDDVYGDDPTINEPEKETSQTFGFQACVYMPSGTMSNQVAVRVHTRPGDELIASRGAHCFRAASFMPE